MGVLDRYIVVYTQSRVSNWPFSHGPYMEDEERKLKLSNNMMERNTQMRQSNLNTI